MYQALVSHFELFNNLPQPECYYCRKNVWSYNIKINSLWQWALGERRDPEGKFGWGCTAILFKQKNPSLPDLVKIRNLFPKTDVTGLDFLKKYWYCTCRL